MAGMSDLDWLRASFLADDNPKEYRHDVQNCPLCGALPVDWGDDPHKAQDALFMALADLRIKCGCGEKPMLTELPGVIAAEIERLRAEIERLTAIGEA